jgi:hypothetical protein
MAEKQKLGEGHRTEDRRFSGRAKRVSHTVGTGENDQVGDKRRLKGAERSKSSGGRVVPIAQTLGGDFQKGQNGSGKRSTPAAKMGGEW